jgi:hypothetical protein
MQSSLPNLPYTNYGDAEPFFFRSSSVETSPRAYPRTDLATLTHWTSFIDEVDQAINSAVNLVHVPLTTFTIGASMASRVNDEEAVRSHAMVSLLGPVAHVVQMLGVQGFFYTSSGTATIGSPDFLWITDEQRPHPKLIVRVSTALCVCTVIEFHFV